MPMWLQNILDWVGSIVPVERWVRAITSVLNAMGLAFILLFILVVLLFVNDWGFSGGQRERFIYFFGTMMLVALLIILVLAMKGDLLWPPAERTHRRGKKYGTEANPKTRREAREAASENAPQLPLPNEKTQIGSPR